MYAGFVTRKRTVKRLGIHQKFDAAAYRMVAPYLQPETFPTLRQVLAFEGINGPDGVKVKSLGIQDPSHMYDPVTDGGVLPELIKNHYDSLVGSLRTSDRVRSGFEAAWLAHYVVDGLTPAHHYPYDEKKLELFGEDSELGLLRKNWQWLGGKGVLSTHLNFEMGVAATLVLVPIRAKLDDAKLAEARRLGAVDFFKQEARAVAELNLYERFYRTGWTAELARTVRQQIAPHATEVVGIIWLLAYLEAGQRELAEIS
ncbi:MAG TPA: hypothetical protein VK963_04355, partial [Candidatus Saccharimonadales bacterium]|nr:hypothetical protein [Candidatus Saccharimonadales bacterium]